MTEQWQELKETIIELRDNNGTATQQEVCKFLANLMDVLEKQMQELKTEKVIKMRDATPEEIELINKYIKSISNPIGVDFWDLEQQPCDDAISRQIISDYVESHIQEINTGYGDLNKHTNEILRMIVDYIEKMESVTPQPKTGHWIPVGERLPKEGIEVLVWYRYWRYGEYNNWYYTYGIGYQFNDYWSVIDGGTQITVYAWQKLPEPYEPQERSGEE